MQNSRKLTEDLYWVGGSDRRLARFENVYPVPRGMSYNSYLLMDQKTVLLDTVDRAVSDVFFENLEALLAGRTLDFIVVQHMEPDHAATLSDLLLRWPDVQVICTAQAQRMYAQFFTRAANIRAVKEGDTLCSGAHTLTFYTAAMVHWPEVMVSYDAHSKILFSADAFGTFGALGGSIWADELDFEREWLTDARRYYANIVGKYGPQVQALLQKAAGLDIAYVCPLHGPVWRKNIGWYVEKYKCWSSYTPEDQAVMVVYGSAYGHTENAAEVFASRLVENGVRDVRLYDVSSVHSSQLVAEAFRCSHLALFSITYNMGIFPDMENLLHHFEAHKLQNRTVALVENGSWAPAAGGLMGAQLEKMKDMRILDKTVTVRSAVQEPEREQLCALADAMAAAMTPPSPAPLGETDASAPNKRWVCKICGYVYEGDELPADFVCPLCKHPASDFELQDV